MNIKQIFYIILLLFCILFIIFAIFIYYNINPVLNSVIAVLLGSSITATFTIGLELHKAKVEDLKNELSLNSDIEYNKQSLNQNLGILTAENKAIDANHDFRPNFPLTIIKTNMWTLINAHIDKSTLGKNYEPLVKISRKIDYINEQQQLRQKYIEQCLIVNNDSIDFQKLKIYNENLISNVKSAIDALNQLSCN